MNQFFRLVYFLKYAKKETAIRILLGLGIVGAQFSQTWFLAKMVIAVCEKRDMKEILLCFLAEFLSLFIRASLIKYQEYFLKKYAAKVKNEIRSQILDKIMVLGPSFKNDQRTGNLQSLITDGVESLEAFLTQYIPQIAVVVFTTIFITSFMCRLDRTVGLLLLFMSAVTVIVPHIFMPAVSDVMVLYWKEYAQLNAQYIDDMQGMSTLLGSQQKRGKKAANPGHWICSRIYEESGNITFRFYINYDLHYSRNQYQHPVICHSCGTRKDSLCSTDTGSVSGG